MTRKCIVCRSSWPAYTAIESFRNRNRMAEIHPRVKCHDDEGEFGPDGQTPATNHVTTTGVIIEGKW